MDYLSCKDRIQSVDFFMQTTNILFLIWNRNILKPFSYIMAYFCGGVLYKRKKKKPIRVDSEGSLYLIP